MLALAAACSGAPIESATEGDDDADDGDDDDGGETDATDASAEEATDASASGTAETASDASADAASDASVDTTAATDQDDADGGTSQGTTDDGETSSDTRGDECHPRLDELAVNVDLEDDALEWIAIHNPCDEAIDLGEYALGWGGSTYAYGGQSLDGLLEPGGCFVIGGPDATATNYEPVFDRAVDLTPDLQNGDEGEADAVGIFVGPAESITEASVPIDTVIYGGDNVNRLVDESGAVGEVDVAHGSDVQTIARTPAGWIVNSSPSPNDCGDPAA
jgi:hypothetical protein